MPPSAAPPGPHPNPPTDLQSVPLPLTEVGTLSTWIRIYPLAYSPEFFDPSDKHRFSAPAGEFGTLYAGNDSYCAFAETLLRDSRLRYVSNADLSIRGRARIEIVRPLHLVDLTGPGLARIRADVRLTTGDYPVAQRWSLALYDHPDRPDGLLWRSRFDPSRVRIAIYERARLSIRCVPLGPLDDPGFAPELGSILNHYGFGMR